MSVVYSGAWLKKVKEKISDLEEQKGVVGPGSEVSKEGLVIVVMRQSKIPLFIRA